MDYIKLKPYRPVNGEICDGLGYDLGGGRVEQGDDEGAGTLRRDLDPQLHNGVVGVDHGEYEAAATASRFGADQDGEFGGQFLRQDLSVGDFYVRSGSESERREAVVTVLVDVLGFRVDERDFDGVQQVIFGNWK